MNNRVGRFRGFGLRGPKDVRVGPGLPRPLWQPGQADAVSCPVAKSIP